MTKKLITFPGKEGPQMLDKIDWYLSRTSRPSFSEFARRCMLEKIEAYELKTGIRYEEQHA
jgi:hypothetical protein